MMPQLDKADKQAGCLSVIMLAVGLLTIGMSFISWEKYSLAYQFTLFLNLAAPLVFPILAIVVMRQVSKVGAGCLLVSIIALILMIAVGWIFVSDNFIRKELAEGLATELIGAIFTAIAIVLIEQALQKFAD